MNKKLEFRWREGSLELVATPQHLVRFSDDEENVTIDFRKYSQTSGGIEYCYTIGYFIYDENEKYWKINFVGDRFKDVPSSQAAKVWEKLGEAYDVLNEWVRVNE